MFPFFAISSANSLMKNENSKGLRRHPCFTPRGHSKKSEYMFLLRTHASTESYTLLRDTYNFPFTPFLRKTLHSKFLFTESNALRKSTKATYNLVLLRRYFWTKEYNVKMWSIVLYPDRNPACSSIIFYFFSAHFVSRLFNIFV